MSEADWLRCTDPQEMLNHLGWPSWSSQPNPADARKRRLFAVACCRRVWHLLTDERQRRVVEVAERYADGLADEDELRTAHTDGFRPHRLPGDITPFHLAATTTGLDEVNAFRFAADLVWQAKFRDAVARGITHIPRDTKQKELAELAALVSDIVGNPFRQVAIDQRWLTPAVLAAAQVAYDERAFDRLPALANALEEAGCANADILAHCRELGDHARGCWVLDRLLGKD